MDAARSARIIDGLPAGVTVVHGVDHEVVARLESLPRTRVIVAPHASDLFDGSVADNVFPDRAVAEQALHVASCDDIPEGPDKRVGEERSACCPAVNGSASPWPAPSRSTRRSSSSRTRPPPSTRSPSRTSRIGCRGTGPTRPPLVFSEAPAWHAVATHHLSVADLLVLTDELSGGPSMSETTTSTARLPPRPTRRCASRWPP